VHPRSVRVAIRRGWQVVELSSAFDTVYREMCSWADANTQGLYRSDRSDYFSRKTRGPRFAFEIDVDATYFILRWPPCLLLN
jgi:hypothetical protein